MAQSPANRADLRFWIQLKTVQNGPKPLPFASELPKNIRGRPKRLPMSPPCVHHDAEKGPKWRNLRQIVPIGDFGFGSKRPRTPPIQFRTFKNHQGEAQTCSHLSFIPRNNTSLLAARENTPSICLAITSLLHTPIHPTSSAMSDAAPNGP